MYTGLFLESENVVILGGFCSLVCRLVKYKIYAEPLLKNAGSAALACT